MIEIIKAEQKPVTDQEAIEALRTIRQYCKEHNDGCRRCCVKTIHRHEAPEDWNLSEG